MSRRHAAGSAAAHRRAAWRNRRRRANSSSSGSIPNRCRNSGSRETPARAAPSAGAARPARRRGKRASVGARHSRGGPERARLQIGPRGLLPRHAVGDAHLLQPRLVGAPADRLQIVRGRGERVGNASDEIAAAVAIVVDRVFQVVRRRELHLAELARPGAGHFLRQRGRRSRSAAARRSARRENAPAGGNRRRASPASGARNSRP